MSWSEFTIRLYGFNRSQEREWRKAGLLMRYIVASGMMSKESKEKEIKHIDKHHLGIKHSISKSNKSALLKAQEEYYNRK